MPTQTYPEYLAEVKDYLSDWQFKPLLTDAEHTSLKGWLSHDKTAKEGAIFIATERVYSFQLRFKVWKEETGSKAPFRGMIETS